MTIDGLRNAGKECWWECNRTAGPCSWCGTGLCCSNRKIENGCDGTFGGGSNHQCSLPDKGRSEILLVYSNDS